MSASSDKAPTKARAKKPKSVLAANMETNVLHAQSHLLIAVV